MKWSRYNIIYQKDEKTFILYNYANDSVIFLLKELKEIVELYKENIDHLFTVHPDLYKELERKRFILDNKINEADSVIDKINKKLDSSDSLKLTINPTLDCNLKCWYCYETHIPNNQINTDTFEAIKKLILMNLSSEKFNKIGNALNRPE